MPVPVPLPIIYGNVEQCQNLAAILLMYLLRTPLCKVIAIFS